MIDFVPFLKIMPIFAVALVSPGPDFMLVTSLSLSRGRLAGIQSAAGIAAGVMLYAALSLWGLGLLFAKIFWLMIAVKILGGSYLCYLGFIIWRSTVGAHKDAQIDVLSPKVPRNAFYLGFLTNLTNPKAIAFFASVFALALTPDTNTSTKITTMFLCAMMPLVWFSFVATALSNPKIRTRYQEWRKAIDRVAGSILMLFGLKLIFSVRA